MSRLSTFPQRPPSEQLCDLHVYKVPLDLWRAPLNNILNQSVTETVSLGIIRVPPDLPLLDIRTEIEKQLEEQAPKDYVFLRSVGRSITRVKARQEYEWTAKHFLPPKHYAPELYILEATPELRDALAISDRSSQLSPVSGLQGSPGARSYRDGYRYQYRQGYPDEARSYQRQGPDKTTPYRHYSPLPKIKPPSPPLPRHGSPEAAFLTDTQPDGSQVPYSDSHPRPEGRTPLYPSRAKLGTEVGEREEEGEEPYSSYPGKTSRQAPPSPPRKLEADPRPPRHQPIGEFYNGGSSAYPSPHALDHGSSPRSPSPHRKGAGAKTYRGAPNGYEREAAYTNNTNEDSGVAGLSPDNQYTKHRDRDNYYRAADSKSRGARYIREDDDEEKRRLREMEDRALMDRERWEQEERRRREEEEERRRREQEREREENRRRKEEEEEEGRRRREEEDRRRAAEEEDRRRDEERRRRDDDERREEERRRREEEEQRRRREEEEEEEEERRRRREEEDRLKGGSDEDADRYPSPLALRSSSAELDGNRDSESAQQQRREEQRKLLEELQEARDSRHSTERDREELVKKAKTLQSKTQSRRNLARDVWKKRYFEEKKKTPPLEDQTNRLKEELDALHRKLMTALEGPKEKNVKLGDNRPSQKNNYKIQCTRLQHDIDDLKRRVENAKMKLTGEMKLRHQADAEVRALRGELTREKIKLSQTRSQHFAALSPWKMETAPIPSISGGEAESAGT